MTTTQRPNRAFPVLQAAILVFSALAGQTAAAACAETESPAPAPSPPVFVVVTGTVLESIDASGYTYMRLKTPDGEIWAAIPKTKVEKGQEVTVVNAAHMDGFESRTLNRKFDRIVFGSLGEPRAGAASASQARAVSSTAEPMASGNQSAEVAEARQQMLAQHAAAAKGPETVGPINFKKAEGPEGRTVAEVFKERAPLKGKEVAVRGKVVRVVKDVMGRNWLHLRDGSGTREAQDDELTVTSADVAAVGDVVVARGILGVDRDFGAGYVYKVILESSRLGN